MRHDHSVMRQIHCPEQLCREVFFEANGVPRTVEIEDRSDEAEGEGPVRKAVREKSDPDVLGSVGAPMAGEVIEVSAKPGGSGSLTPLHLNSSTQQDTVVKVVRIARNMTHV